MKILAVLTALALSTTAAQALDGGGEWVAKAKVRAKLPALDAYIDCDRVAEAHHRPDAAFGVCEKEWKEAEKLNGREAVYGAHRAIVNMVSHQAGAR